MLLKLAALSLIAATAHMEKVGPGRQQWIYDNGANKGYVCAIVQQNGSAFDTYLPSLFPAAAAAKIVAPIPWLHYANQADAMDSVNVYCPKAGAQQAKSQN